jgi:hypothetical protein
MATQLDVDLGERQAVVRDEGEEVFLEVAAGAAVLGAFEADVHQLRLTPRTAEETGSDGVVEIIDRALDRGYRDVVAVGGEEPSPSPPFLI